MRKLTKLGLLAALGAMPAAAQAGPNTQSGTLGDLVWTAASTIIGRTSDATVSSGGDPRYVAAQPQYSGVVSLIMDEGAAGSFICSGSLLPDRMSILTAGHCVSSGAGTANPVTTTAYFYGGNDPDTVVPFNPVATAVTVSQYFVDPLYTGQVIDQNDIAVLRLSAPAPAFATAYDIYTGGDLTGQSYNIAGYGGRSDVGGSLGVDLGTGRLRQGDNSYDFRLGSPDFGGALTGIDPTTGLNLFGGTVAIDYSYIADFDSGSPANDASSLLAGAIDPALAAKYANLGTALEVGTAGGDSGGPQFIDGKIASVTSYGLTFGSELGDVDDALDDTYGELNGFVPTFIHADFIFASEVPEASTWASLMVGLAAIGTVLRRRPAAQRAGANRRSASPAG